MPNINTASGTSTIAGFVPVTRRINTTAPLSGGGDLSADRTIAIDTSGFGDVFQARSNTFAAGFSNYFNGNTQFRGEMQISGANQVVIIYDAIFSGGTLTLGGSRAAQVQIVDQLGLNLVFARVPIYGTPTSLVPLSPDRYVTSGELAGVVTMASGSGTGTVTNIKPGSNLIFNPASAITTTGSIALSSSLTIPGDVQVSGLLYVASGLRVGDPIDTVGQTLWGQGSDTAGNNYVLQGSGNLTGTTRFTTFTAGNRVRFIGIPVVFDSASDVQASGALRTYGRSGDKLFFGNQTAYTNQRINGSTPETDGTAWAFIGSGVLQGELSATQLSSKDSWTLSLPVVLDATPASLHLLTGIPLQADGPVTLSGGRFRAGAPLNASQTILGDQYDLTGSGIFTGTVRFINWLPQDTVAFDGIPVWFGGAGTGPTRIGEAGQLLVSGSPSTFFKTVNMTGPLHVGNILNTASVAGDVFDFTGSGTYTGSFYWLNLQPNDIAKFDLNVAIRSPLQTSGVVIAYRPLYSRTVSGATRYITSGELTTGAGTGDALRGADNFWTGSQNVFSKGTTVTISGPLHVGGVPSPASIAGDVYDFTGSGTFAGEIYFINNQLNDYVKFDLPVIMRSPVQISGAFRAYGRAGDRVFIGNQTGYTNQRFNGSTPETDGTAWAAVGSGVLQGTLSATQLSTKDGWTLSLPVTLDALPAQLHLLTGVPLIAEGDVQVSGAFRAYSTVDVRNDQNAATLVTINNANAGSNARAQLSLYQGATEQAIFGWVASGLSLRVFNRAAGSLRFGTSNADTMAIDSAGKVGIGTLTPAATLDVIGTARVSSNVQISGALLAYNDSRFTGPVHVGGPSPTEVPGDGFVYDITGSGTFAGAIFFTNSQLRDLIQFDLPVYMHSTVQTSGTVLAYRPIYSQSVSGPSRYVTSGELKTGAGTGDALRGSDNYWTGSVNVFGPATSLISSGLFIANSTAEVDGAFSARAGVSLNTDTGNTNIVGNLIAQQKITGVFGIITTDVQVSGTLITYGSKTDHLAIGNQASSAGLAGDAYDLVGSGTLTGPVFFTSLIPTDQVAFSAVNVWFGNGAQIRVSTLGDLQISGARNIVYKALHGNGVITGANRYVTSGELSAGSGSGTVTNIKPGSNLVFSPASAITTTGTIALVASPTIPGALTVVGQVDLNTDAVSTTHVWTLVADGPVVAFNEVITGSTGRSTRLLGPVQISGDLIAYSNARIGGAGTSYSTVVLADSPTLYWRLDESSGITAADTSGNSHLGTYSGGITYGQTGAVTGNSAIHVVGSGDVQSQENLTIGVPMSVEAWVNMAKLPAADTNVVGQNNAFGGGNNLNELYVDTSGYVRFYVTDPVSKLTSIAPGAATLTFNAWHHVAGTADGTTARAYLDGVEVGNVAAGGNSGSEYWFVAGYSTGGTGKPAGLYGSVDEVAVYGSALSAARVLAHYNAAAGAQGGATFINVAGDVQVSGMLRSYSNAVFTASGGAVFSAQGDLQVSGAIRDYGALTKKRGFTADDLLIGRVNQDYAAQVLHGANTDASGFSWFLFGSGIISGSQRVQGTAGEATTFQFKDASGFGINVIFQAAAPVQVSGGMLLYGGNLQISANSTGGGTALLGANCPAVTATAPYTWVQIKAADGSTVYVPAWK